MAVTSANHTGQPPATDAASARVAFPGRVREAGSPGAGSPDRSEGDILLLDGGATPGPVPSTIVSLAGDHAYSPRIIRDGVLSLSQLAVVLDPVLTQAGASPMTAGSEVPRP